MAVFPAFRKSYSPAEAVLTSLVGSLDKVVSELDRPLLDKLVLRARADLCRQDNIVTELLTAMPEEALLKVDVTVAEPRATGRPIVHTALSSKWSLHTDRAQDCVSQGSKLVTHRRGRMPHFGVVTIEPRSAMLKILCDGSGASTASTTWTCPL
jgi:hypothetical protein